jgi:hypothetical protein
MQSYHAAEIFLIAGAILILVDYYFATDWPAHVGYFCVAASVFFHIWTGSAWEVAQCLLVAVAVDKVLAVLHHLIFFRFLANAPGTERYEMEQMDEATA